MSPDRIVLGDSIRYYLENKQVTEAQYRAVHPLPASCGGAPGGTPTTGWPILSDALAVHPEQIEEAKKDAAMRGIDVDFVPEDGRAVLRDRDHRRRMLRAYGFHDRDGGYGDG